MAAAATGGNTSRQRHRSVKDGVDAPEQNERNERDLRRRVAQAVAIRDGRFIAVGTDRDMRPLTGPGTRVVDLAGRTVIPGLIDSHIHATLAGLSWDD